MNTNNKRNTAKEKQLNNRGFPYKSFSNRPYRINKPKYKLTDESGKEYGRFRLRVNAIKERKRLKQEEFRNDIYLETL